MSSPVSFISNQMRDKVLEGITREWMELYPDERKAFEAEVAGMREGLHRADGMEPNQKNMMLTSAVPGRVYVAAQEHLGKDFWDNDEHFRVYAKIYRKANIRNV